MCVGFCAKRQIFGAADDDNNDDNDNNNDNNDDNDGSIK